MGNGEEHEKEGRRGGGGRTFSLSLEHFQRGEKWIGSLKVGGGGKGGRRKNPHKKLNAKGTRGVFSREHGGLIAIVVLVVAFVFVLVIALVVLLAVVVAVVVATS